MNNTLLMKIFILWFHRYLLPSILVYLSPTFYCSKFDHPFFLLKNLRYFNVYNTNEVCSMKNHICENMMYLKIFYRKNIWSIKIAIVKVRWQVNKNGGSNFMTRRVDNFVKRVSYLETHFLLKTLSHHVKCHKNRPAHRLSAGRATADGETQGKVQERQPQERWSHAQADQSI